MGYVNGASGVSTGAATSLSFTHSLTAGTNRCIVVTLSYWDNSGSPALGTTTYDAQNCTTQKHSSTGSIWGTAICTLPDASISGSGNKTTTISFGATACDEIAGCVMAYDGIDQTTGPFRAGSNVGSVAASESIEEAFDVTVTCTVGDIVVQSGGSWSDANDGTRTMSGNDRQQANGGAADQTNNWARDEVASSTSYHSTLNHGIGIASCAIIPVAGASAAVTGTITASVNEGDVRTGGKTLVITLTGATWIP